MSKVRVYEVAKQLNLDPKAVVGLFQAIGVVEVRNHMSSVEPEAIERVKRHLEKQRTHDVVEERIRPGVVKRRAVAKPGAPASSPAVVPSVPDHAFEESAPSAPASEAEGHGHVVAPVATRRSSPTLVAREPVARDRSSRALHVVLEPPRPPSAPLLPQPSAPEAVAREPEKAPEPPLSAPVVIAPVIAVRPPPSELVIEPVVEQAAVVEAPVPTVLIARQVPVVMEPTPTPEPVRVPTPPPPPPPRPPPPPPPRVPTPPSVVIPVPVPAAVKPRPRLDAVVIPQRREPPPLPPVSPPVARPAAPKTGVEYWAGRPGVPMPTPTTGPRMMTSPNTSNMPRRVQYDPRSGTTTGTAPTGVRPPMRGPVQQGGRGGGSQGGRSGQQFQTRRGPPMPQRKSIVSTQVMSAHKKVIRIEENITLQGMAQRMSLKSTELLMKLLSMGMTGVHINTTLDADTAKILASEFGWEVEDVARSEEENIAAARGEESVTAKAVAPSPPEAGLEPRPPVVTVMGHVDHGKTSLLDRIRKANVAAGEAGGITQHIGAYKVSTTQGTVVFLDTPGHEAFTQMRARGAGVTDIVILVVAADDGVMPQTREAISHAKAAKVPIIVAVNKIDKPTADVERVRRELVEFGLQPEEWGGDTMFVNVSALSGIGVPQLLETVALQAEVLELKANGKKPANGTVLEAKLDKGRGPVATVLIQDGTLHVGDFVLAGPGFGKVRAMTNEHGKQVYEAGPSTPVEILGLSDVPGAGDPVHAVKDPKKAQEIAESRKGKMARSLIPATAKVSLEELSKRIQDSAQQELRVIIKGDVQGSVEAVADSLAKLSGDKVRLLIIHAGVGAITEGDVNLAIASKAVILGFNQRPAGKAAALAEENKIEIRLYSIIYNAVDDVRAAMEGLLPPTLIEKSNGRAEVRKLFKVKNVAIAGSFVTQGRIVRGGRIRLLRTGAGVVFDGRVSALKRFKDDAREVVEGFECGISLESFNDIKE
ncbi:MAG: translation initiation factor IF-2, partial [Myxococcales bacterium]